MTASPDSGDPAHAERPRRDYRPAWRCRACGTIHDDHPEACRECGHDAFRAVERWAG